MSVSSGSGTLDVREARPEDEAAILDYYRAQLEAGARVATIMRWRAQSPDASGGNAPVIAVLDGALSGIVNAVSVTLTQRGRRIAAAWQGDSVVSPSVRGRGVGKRLVHAASPGVAVVLAKGTSPAMHALRRSLGAQDVANAEFLVRGLRFSGASPLRRLYNGLLAMWGAIRGVGSGAALPVQETHEFTDEFNALDIRLSATDEIRVAKPAAFLRWRYLQAPGRRYRVFRVDSGGELRGAAVLRDPAEPGGDAWLIDLLVDPHDREVVRALGRAMIGAARGAGAAALRAFATSSRVRAVLFHLGFVKTRSTPEFTCWVRDPARGPAPGSAWHICHGDGDLELY